MPIEVGLSPARTSDGEFVLGSVVDITERRRVEREKEALVAQLKTLNAELESRVEIRTRELTQALKEREVLLQEVHHRVKNNLQVISSMIHMQADSVRDSASRDALEECQARILTIALIHEKLYQSNRYDCVPFSQYASSLATDVLRQAAGVSARTISLDLAVGEVTLSVGKAIPTGLLLNELLTNALKHAFVGGRSGTIRVELQVLDGHRLRVTVRDDGVGLPEGFKIGEARSLGLQLVSTLTEQLHGVLEVESRGGAEFRVTFPMDV